MDNTNNPINEETREEDKVVQFDQQNQGEETSKKLRKRNFINSWVFLLIIWLIGWLAGGFFSYRYLINNMPNVGVRFEDGTMLPCSLPFEMHYITKIESGVYVNSGYYGMCFLDINIDEERETAEVFISYYPDDTSVYGKPSHRRYSCTMVNGKLIENETIFVIGFDPSDHSVKISLIDEDAYSTKWLDIKTEMIKSPFCCLYVDEEVPESMEAIEETAEDLSDL